MKRLYDLYRYCMVHIVVKTSTGDYANGAGFHIGDGYLVTARHVVENQVIVSVSGYRYSSDDISIKKIFYPSDPRVDLALLATDFSLQYFLEKVTITDTGGNSSEKVGLIPLGGHLDDWLGDELVLSKVLVMGYPPIPLSQEPVLVAVQGEINAIVDKYCGPHPHFVISSIPRGGFSGGPVISEYNFLLGIFVESLLEADQTVELGFASVLSIEPLLVLLQENGIYIHENSNILAGFQPNAEEGV